MKTIQPFLFFALFLLSSSAMFGKSLPVSMGNEPAFDCEKIKITLCISGRNWKACLSIETSANLPGTSLTGTGTINDATKTLTITGLPKELLGQVVKVTEDVTFTRTNTVKGQTQEESITLKRGTFTVSKAGSFSVPVNRIAAINK